MTSVTRSTVILGGLALLAAVGCGDSDGGAGGTGGLGATPPFHTVTLVNNCDQQLWLASNATSPTTQSDWALAPRCTENSDCADGQTCTDNACTCTTDDDCSFDASTGTTHAACSAGQCTSSATVDVSGGWSGRFWARTGCSGSNSSFVCETGQCGAESGGDFDCATTASTANLATLFELFAAGTSGIDNFDVSLVSGYNVPVVVTVELPADHAKWQPSTHYDAGAGIIESVGSNTFGFTAAGKSGTSGTTKPTFPGTWTESVMDGADIDWINVGPQCQKSGCQSDLLSTCPTELQVEVGNMVVACDAPANACNPSTASCHADLPYYQCQNNDGPTDLFSDVLDLQSPNADTYVCFSDDDCPGGTSCSLNPEFESGFTMPAGTGLCLPVTQNGGCTPADDGEICPLRTFPFVEYQCQTLKNVASNAQVCIPPTTSGFGNLWWNAANWEQVTGGAGGSGGSGAGGGGGTQSIACTTDGDCVSGDKCLDTPTLGGARQCPEGSDTCTCYSPKPCGTAGIVGNGGCPGPKQCLNKKGVPNGTDSVDCSTETCYCGPQGIFSGACGPTNPAWNTAAGNVGNWTTVFKTACPVAYSYQYDDPSSNWSCPNPADDLVNYRVDFCLEPEAL